MPSEDQIKTGAQIIQGACQPGYRAALNLARRVLEAVEGKWGDEAMTTGGPDHDGLTGKPFGDHEDMLRGTPFERPSRVKSGSFGTDQLNSLAEKLMIALGDSTTMDTLTGDPGVLVDRIIAERDALALDKASRDGVIGDLQAEVARLRGQLPSLPVHEVEIMHERTHGDGAEVRIKCPYPECSFDMTLAGPVASDVNDMVPALAEAHRGDMEVDSGQHGPGRV